MPALQALPLVHPAVVSPAGTLVHVPTLPGSVHDAHVPPQAALQHMPPTQAELAQSVVATHVLPLAQGGQLPPQSTSVSLPSLILSVQLAHASM